MAAQPNFSWFLPRLDTARLRLGGYSYWLRSLGALPRQKVPEQECLRHFPRCGQADVRPVQLSEYALFYTIQLTTINSTFEILPLHQLRADT